ncbi:MAG: hypothetical protein A2X05_03785 [Bacteroidetes bacterium GWE2_41_25]|nr:MAG: hypothetical protein A2X03_18950 [Bacteroidetes bacterium GWA2_40_15]OFX91042.1 MAG: hypothetical protein A2X05_03785 [Bacteroidetes bacterium GWE2_41_25]HBQ82169.1 acyl-CoA reductase [Bacteroidales bacterium]
MDLKERIEAFAGLGALVRKSLSDTNETDTSELSLLINNQQHKNPWFTPENVRAALSAIANELTAETLYRWTGMYPELKNVRKPFTVGIIMAGNIPMVGFHDFLSVLITGNNVLTKTSSKDSDLIVHFSELLCSINPAFRNMIRFTEDTLSGFDAVIATGSNNTSRYFEAYFGKYPNIIRRNRNSIAILDGTESEYELKGLGNDIFSYFGLGCRNVSKLYLPSGYKLSELTETWESFSGIINHNKYANNYDFNKAVYLVNKEQFLDTGYLLLREEKNLSSPVAVIYYEYYNSYDFVIQDTDLLKDRIQCIVSKNHTPFGKAQQPLLWDYADGIDIIEFLLKKKSSGIL